MAKSKFERYWDNLGRQGRTDLATKTGLSWHYLWSMARGRRKAGAQTMAILVQADPKITHHMLRPDLYQLDKRDDRIAEDELRAILAKKEVRDLAVDEVESIPAAKWMAAKKAIERKRKAK